MIQPSIQQVDAAVRAVLFGRKPSASGSGGLDPVFTGHLFALRHAEALRPDAREVAIAPGTVVTPLARDYLKRQGIHLRFVSRSESAVAAERGEWGFAIEDAESGLLAAFRRSLLGEVADWHEITGSIDGVLGWVNAGRNRGAMMLTDESSVAVWLACQSPGVRAAQACDVDGVERAVRRLGVNLLVIEPAGKSISLMRQMSRSFRRAGAPRLPEYLERDLEIVREAAPCGSPR